MKNNMIEIKTVILNHTYNICNHKCMNKYVFPLYLASTKFVYTRLHYGTNNIVSSRFEGCKV